MSYFHASPDHNFANHCDDDRVARSLTLGQVDFALREVVLEQTEKLDGVRTMVTSLACVALQCS
jgi:hypothetical protein